MTIEGSEPVGLAPDGVTLIDGSGRAIPIGGGDSNVFVQDSDPGAVGPGKLWVDISDLVGNGIIVNVRNETDDGWYTVFQGLSSIPFFSAGGIVQANESTGETQITGKIKTSSEATSATAGAHGDVPAQVAGYWVIASGAGDVKVPFYNV